MVCKCASSILDKLFGLFNKVLPPEWPNLDPGKVGEEAIRLLKVWAGLGGGVGGASSLGDTGFML